MLDGNNRIGSMKQHDDDDVGDDVEVEGGKLVLKRLQEEELGVYACLDDLGDVLKQFEVALAFRCFFLTFTVTSDLFTHSEKRA